MMENVPGLAGRGQFIFDKFLNVLRRLGYQYDWRIEQMADFGLPQSRRRLVLLAGHGFKVAFPNPSHARSPKCGSDLAPWTTVRDAIHHMGAPVTLSTALGNGGPQAHNWHVVPDLQPQTKDRLKAAEPGQTWLRVDESVRPRCHQNGYDGFTNVYGRMAWDQASPTITGGCTTPCMGRFGHPDKRRYTISVREAALLQGFPENYRLVTDQMGAVCDLVGNAVPPRYAELAGKKVLEALNAHRAPKGGYEGMSRWPGNAENECTTFGGLSRGQLMSRVRSKGNKTTEKCLASLLRKARLCGWRRHQALPGRPDFAWPRAKVAVFVDGCFWHGHDCGKNVNPRTNVGAWRKKLEGNKARDRKATRMLRQQGWKVGRIWECQLAKNPVRCVARIGKMLDPGRRTGYSRNGDLR